MGQAPWIQSKWNEVINVNLVQPLPGIITRLLQRRRLGFRPKVRNCSEHGSLHAQVLHQHAGHRMNLVRGIGQCMPSIPLHKPMRNLPDRQRQLGPVGRTHFDCQSESAIKYTNL